MFDIDRYYMRSNRNDWQVIFFILVFRYINNRAPEAIAHEQEYNFIKRRSQGVVKDGQSRDERYIRLKTRVPLTSLCRVTSKEC